MTVPEAYHHSPADANEVHRRVSTARQSSLKEHPPSPLAPSNLDTVLHYEIKLP